MNLRDIFKQPYLAIDYSIEDYQERREDAFADGRSSHFCHPNTMTLLSGIGLQA